MYNRSSHDLLNYLAKLVRFFTIYTTFVVINIHKMSTLSILADNIRYLRMRGANITQHQIAEKLMVSRDSYAKYETGKASPPLDILLAISRFHHVSTDLLLTVNLRKYRLEEILQLPDNRILLPMKTDSLGENKIEIIPYKASMGYLSGYADPEYIEGLQTMSLPFLHNGKYRAFPAVGDSMPPYKNGTYIIGQFVDEISDIKIGKTYIIISRSGILFKRIEQINKESITVKSDNNFYGNFDILYTELKELWKYAGSYSPQELEIIDFADDDVKSMLIKLMHEIKELKTNINH